MKIYQSVLQTPIGKISILASNKGLVTILFPSSTFNKSHFPDETIIFQDEENNITETAKEQLFNYFNNGLTQFNVPLQLMGTPFQINVWEHLQKIPFGKTLSYFALADSIGHKKAVRAVGNANGKNPIPIIVPCHRVIQKDGKLGGYSGGLEIKRWLLQHEGNAF